MGHWQNETYGLMDLVLLLGMLKKTTGVLKWALERFQ
jgi:hypothetical protein